MTRANGQWPGPIATARDWHRCSRLSRKPTAAPPARRPESARRPAKHPDTPVEAAPHLGGVATRRRRQQPRPRRHKRPVVFECVRVLEAQRVLARRQPHIQRSFLRRRVSRTVDADLRARRRTVDVNRTITGRTLPTADFGWPKNTSADGRSPPAQQPSDNSSDPDAAHQRQG